MSRFIIVLLVFCIAALLLSACGSSEKLADTDAVATQVAQQVAATLTSEAARVLSGQGPTDTSVPPANTPLPTVTATETTQPTPVPTDTPVPPTKTSAPTPTEAPTSTPAPTATPTPRPSVGDTVRCGYLFDIKVLRPPSFAKQLNVLDTAGYLTLSNSEAAKGQWLLMFFDLTNLKSEPDGLGYDGLAVLGDLSGREVLFKPSSWGPSMFQKSEGISYWSDEAPPGITMRGMAIFDVNPAASEFRVLFRPNYNSYNETGDCEAVVWLQEPAIGVSADSPIVVAPQVVNVRSGPGTGYGVVGKSQAGQRYAITGKSADSAWWQIDFGGKKGWVAASVASAAGPIETVPVVKDVAPPPTVAPKPTPVPLSREMPLGREFQTTLWGMKLYDVKRAKAVYWFGDAEIANGTWLIPLVEFRNLGSGTNDPSSNLHFYLQDEKRRSFDYDYFTTGDLGAAWQFKAGHVYDDINPGSVLGIAIPFDVSPDLGDMWLRVKEAPNVVMYLGNVSQMPESK